MNAAIETEHLAKCYGDVLWWELADTYQVFMWNRELKTATSCGCAIVR